MLPKCLGVCITNVKGVAAWKWDLHAAGNMECSGANAALHIGLPGTQTMVICMSPMVIESAGLHVASV